MTGLKEIEEVSYDDEPPKNIMERFWSWLVRCVSYRSFSRSFIDYYKLISSDVYIFLVHNSISYTCMAKLYIGKMSTIS